MKRQWEPGTRFAPIEPGAQPNWPGIWAHLGWVVAKMEPGLSILEWEPDTNHCFLAGERWIVHGGMITTFLDTAMGDATWGLLNEGEAFLTADLRAEFYRPTYPGLIRAEGYVVHKTRKITFAAADLYDAEGALLASTRGTQVTLEVPS